MTHPATNAVSPGAITAHRIGSLPISGKKQREITRSGERQSACKAAKIMTCARRRALYFVQAAAPISRGSSERGEGGGSIRSGSRGLVNGHERRRGRSKQQVSRDAGAMVTAALFNRFATLSVACLSSMAVQCTHLPCRITPFLDSLLHPQHSTSTSKPSRGARNRKNVASRCAHRQPGQ